MKAESASEQSDDDKDAKKMDRRRISFNKKNSTGQDFESHLKVGPAPNVQREIQNMFDEYRESEDQEHAKEELIDICDKHKIPRHQFVGYFLNNSLSEKPDDFRHLLNLVLQYFFIEQKLLTHDEMKNA